jgi:hypothetical protein
MTDEEQSAIQAGLPNQFFYVLLFADRDAGGILRYLERTSNLFTANSLLDIHL